MKALASLLVVIVLLHCACIGRCWAEAFTPPCHEDPQEPETSLCSEGPALEAKASPVVKCILETVDELSFAPVLLAYADFPMPFETVSPPLLRQTVLRI